MPIAKINDELRLKPDLVLVKLLKLVKARINPNKKNSKATKVTMTKNTFPVNFLLRIFTTQYY